MKEYRIILSPSLQISFKPQSTIVALQKVRNWLWNMSFWLGGALIGLLIIAGPLYALTEVRIASLTLYHLLTLGVAGALTLFWQILLGQWKSLADPQGFLGVLFFALLAILGWIVSPLFVEVTSLVNYRYINTFGSISTKAIAGLAIIGLVGSYYLINQFINSAIKMRIAAGLAVLVMIVSPLLLIGYSQNKNVDIFVVLSALGFLTLVASSFYLKLPKKAEIPLLVGALICLTIVQMFLRNAGWHINFALLLVTIVWGWLEFWSRKLTRYKTAVMSGIALVLIGLLVWQIIASSGQAAVEMRNLVQIPLSNFAGRNVNEIFFGSALTVTMAPRAFWHVVLFHQGILGLLAYLILGITGVVCAVRALANTHYSKIFVPGFFFLMAMSLFSNIGLMLVFWTWLLFSLFTVGQKLVERAKSTTLTLPAQIWRWKLPRWWQVVALLMVPVLAYIWWGVNVELLTLLVQSKI